MDVKGICVCVFLFSVWMVFYWVALRKRKLPSYGARSWTETYLQRFLRRHRRVCPIHSADSEAEMTEMRQCWRQPAKGKYRCYWCDRPFNDEHWDWRGNRLYPKG